MAVLLGAVDQKPKRTYRIRKSDGRFKNAGTGKDSWFTLDEARKKVNYDKDEMIVESDGVRILWEVF